MPVPISALPNVGNMQVGDKPTGLRDNVNVTWDFPGNGILDQYGNFLLTYSSTATEGPNAASYPSLIARAYNGAGVQGIVQYTADGVNSNISIEFISKGFGTLTLAAGGDIFIGAESDPIVGVSNDASLGSSTPLSQPYILPTQYAVYTYVNTKFASGVTSITGTSDEIIASSSTGAVTLSTPQPIATTSSPTFLGLNISSLTASQAVVTDASKNLSSLGYSTTAIASNIVERDSNANIFYNNNFSNNASTVAAAGTTVLTAASAKSQILTTSGSNGQTYQLPDATTLSISSQVFLFNNNSAGSLIINNNGGVAQYTVPAGGYVSANLLDNSTTNGSWDFHPLAPSTVTWGSGTTGLVMNSVLSTSSAISAGAASSTSPVFIPQRGTANTGYSGDATHLYGVVGGATAFSASATAFNLSYLTASQAVVTDSSKNLISLAYTSANTISTIVARDSSGNFSAGTITASLSGNATTATSPQTGSAHGAVTLNVSGNFQSVAPSTSGNVLTSNGTDWVSQAPATSGTVTSVGLQVNSGSSSGIYTISGSPITSSGTFNIALTGTSGGIPYFSSSSVLSSSAALTIDQLVVGGGTGAAPFSLAAGSAGQVLVSNGSAALPTWQNSGGLAGSITAITNTSSPYTVLSTDQIITTNSTSGAITINLPNSTTTGRIIVVKDLNGSAATNGITVTTVGGVVTIDGTISKLYKTQYFERAFLFNGTNYSVIYSYDGPILSCPFNFNTYVGINAGNISGSASTAGNTCVGNNAGAAITTSVTASTFIGYNSGTLITTGGSCIGVGYGTLSSLVTGSDCVAIGVSALSKWTAANGQIVAIGTNAAANQVGGSFDNGVYIGFACAGALLTNGASIGIGGRVYNAVTSLSNSVSIGPHSMQVATTISNSIAIGISALGSGLNLGDCIAIGTQSLQNFNNSSGKIIAIGTNAGQAMTGTVNNYSVLLGYGVAALATSASSLIAIGGNVLPSLLTGTNDVCIGVSNGTNYTGAESSNILIGCLITGTVGENNVLRIGNATGTSAGNLNSAYIYGISSNTQNITGSIQLVTLNPSTAQLGVTSGPLPQSIGGTGSSTTFTAGSVIFSNGASGYTQDNSHFFYNSSTHNLGLGTSTPGATLVVSRDSAGGNQGYLIVAPSGNDVYVASTETNLILTSQLNRSWPAGNITIQRDVLFNRPGYFFQTGSSTITDAATFGISGAPTCILNGVITNSHAHLISSAAVANTTNSYGLTVNAQTGATNNYAAQFLGANTGFGISAPVAMVHIVKTTEQLRVGYDGSNYYTTTVSSTGSVTLDAVGSGSSFTFSDPVNVSNSAGNVITTQSNPTASAYTTLIDTVNTTDATVTTVHTITLATDTTYTIRGMVRARRTGGTSGSAGDSGGYSFFGAIRNVSGTASLISSVDVSSKENQAGWDVTFTASGATILIQVTGAANNNITWDLFLEQFGR